MAARPSPPKTKDALATPELTPTTTNTEGARAEEGDTGDSAATTREVLQDVIPKPDGVRLFDAVVSSPQKTKALVIGQFKEVQEGGVPYPDVGHSPLQHDIWLFEDGELERLTQTLHARRPIWAPEGERFAYMRGVDIAIYDLTRRKTHTVREGYVPEQMEIAYDYMAYAPVAWDPDGRYLAMEASNGGVGVGLIYDTTSDCIVEWSPHEWIPNPERFDHVVVEGSGDDTFFGRDMPQPASCPDITLRGNVSD